LPLEKDDSTFTIASLRLTTNLAPKSNHPEEERRINRVLDLISAGTISKAFKALNPTPVAPPDENTIKILRQLHPQKIEENFVDSNSPSPEVCNSPISFTLSKLRSKVRECANLTAPENTKFSVDNIKKLIGSPN